MGDSITEGTVAAVTKQAGKQEQQQHQKTLLAATVHFVLGSTIKVVMQPTPLTTHAASLESVMRITLSPCRQAIVLLRGCGRGR
jgi:hypothetical protein